MLPKKNRITTVEFERFFRKSSRIRCGRFTFLLSRGGENPKFAVVVGKKISKLATRRNRVRRQVYSAFSRHLTGKISGKNVICLYNGGEILENTAELDSAMQKLLKFTQSVPDHHSSRTFKNAKK